MSVFYLVLKELAHRKLNALLAMLGIAMAVALFVAYFTTAEASDRETTRVTRDLGFNLRIIPGDTDMERFWMAGFSDKTMPEDTVQRLASDERVFLAFNHIVGSLQGKYILDGGEVLLTGLAPAVTAPAQRKQSMGFTIEQGTVYLGFEVARRLGLKKGDPISIGGAKHTVARCLAESGTDDDLRVFGLLSDVQRALNQPRRINEIKAIDCICLTPEHGPLEVLRAELARILPEAKIVQVRAIADARARQRQMVTKYAAFLTPFIVVVCGVWVGALAVLNVRERRIEIGLLRALGRGSTTIASLFLARLALTGIVGAVSGYITGSLAALWFGPHIFPVTAGAIRAESSLLILALVAAPVFAALAGFVPAMSAVAQDPAVILREE